VDQDALVAGTRADDVDQRQLRDRASQVLVELSPLGIEIMHPPPLVRVGDADDARAVTHPHDIVDVDPVVSENELARHRAVELHAIKRVAAVELAQA
jgi:hypothetical protein